MASGKNGLIDYAARAPPFCAPTMVFNSRTAGAALPAALPMDSAAAS